MYKKKKKKGENTPLFGSRTDDQSSRPEIVDPGPWLSQSHKRKPKRRKKKQSLARTTTDSITHSR